MSEADAVRHNAARDLMTSWQVDAPTAAAPAAAGTPGTSASTHSATEFVRDPIDDDLRYERGWFTLPEWMPGGG